MLARRILSIRLRSNVNLICKYNYTKCKNLYANDTKTIGFNNKLSNNLHLNNYHLYSFNQCTIYTSPKRYNPIISIFVRQVLKVTTLFTARYNKHSIFVIYR